LLCEGADEVVRNFRAARDGGLRDVEAIELIGQDSKARCLRAALAAT